MPNPNHTLASRNRGTGRRGSGRLSLAAEAWLRTIRPLTNGANRANLSRLALASAPDAALAMQRLGLDTDALRRRPDAR